jgi:hypothetical protein
MAATAAAAAAAADAAIATAVAMPDLPDKLPSVPGLRLVSLWCLCRDDVIPAGGLCFTPEAEDCR